MDDLTAGGAVAAEVSSDPLVPELPVLDVSPASPLEAVAAYEDQAEYFAPLEQEAEERADAMFNDAIVEIADVLGVDPDELVASLLQSGEPASEADPLAAQLLEEERHLEMERGAAEHRAQLVTAWNATTGLSVDPDAVYERTIQILRAQPKIATAVTLAGERGEDFAEGALRAAYESLATEAAGQEQVFSAIEAETRLLGVPLDAELANRIYGLANEVLPVMQEQEPNPVAAAELAIRFATRDLTGRDGPPARAGATPEISRLATYYAPRIREEAQPVRDGRVVADAGARATERPRDASGKFKAVGAAGLSQGLSRVTAKHADLIRQEAAGRSR